MNQRMADISHKWKDKNFLSLTLCMKPWGRMTGTLVTKAISPQAQWLSTMTGPHRPTAGPSLGSGSCCRRCGYSSTTVSQHQRNAKSVQWADSSLHGEGRVCLRNESRLAVLAWCDHTAKESFCIRRKKKPKGTGRQLCGGACAQPVWGPEFNPSIFK